MKENSDLDKEFNTPDAIKCPACGSYNVIVRPGMLIDRMECLDCGYEEYL